MPVIRLETKTVAKPWGRWSTGPWFDDVAAREEPVGEIWFELPPGSGLDDPELLVKYLFTSRRLSVQVHPDDATAKVYGLPRDKSEAWQILEAEPGASVALGLRTWVTRERLRAAARDGSIVGLLDWKPARAGDFWYAPAGTIHAIGAGLSLIEIQQNVDVTYRLYDYGSNRELHLDEAVEAARPAPYEAPFAPFELARGRRVLAAGGPFVVERWADAFTGILAPRRGEPVWLIPLRGEAVVGSEPIEPGGVWIVAGDAGVNFTGSCDLLVAYSGRAVHEALIG